MLVSQSSGPLLGEWIPPGDKSISHRAIIFGAIGKGITSVTGFLESEDCLHTLQAFSSMGVVFEKKSKNALLIHGVGKLGLVKPDAAIDCGNSGTTMRLLSGLLAAQSFDSVLIGDESLQKRPMLRVAQPLIKMGALVMTTEGHAPIFIKGNQVLHGMDYTLPHASAQVKSCLLLAGMYAQGVLRLHEKVPTRNHTEWMLKIFGYPLVSHGQSISIQKATDYEGIDLEIPGDLSSAAFFIVAATLIPGSNFVIRRVGLNPTRLGFIEILKKMGADIVLSYDETNTKEPNGDIFVRSAELSGMDIPSALVAVAIDEFPILLVAASLAKGKTRIQGAIELRYKESDRIAVMVDGLLRCGVTVIETEDGAEIVGGNIVGGCVIDSAGDHRVAMAFAIAGLVAKHPITIKGAEHIATSFPNFLEDARALQLNIEEFSHAEC